MLVTGGAGSAASAAGRATAASTAAGAVVAEGRFATLATSSCLIVDQIAAIGAGDADPLGQRYVGTLGVVRGERLGDDREEVEEPAVAKRCADRGVAVAFTKLFVADVGMDDRVVMRRGAGRQGANEVRERGGGAATPCEFDFKRSQLDFLQNDRLGDDRHERFSQTDSHILKLAR